MMFELFESHDPCNIALCDEVRIIRYGEMSREIKIRMDKLVNVRSLAIALDNSADWVLWDLAALRAGIPCVPLPSFFTENQISHVLRAAGISHIISSDGLRDTGVPAVEIPAGTVKITFTSGTTGTPKGVCLSEKSMADVSGSIVQLLGNKFTGKHLSVLPLPILLENVAGVYAALMAGCSVILKNQGSYGAQYQNLHDILDAEKITSIILVPEILRLLMAQVSAKGSLSNLKFIAVGGSKIDPAIIRQARQMGLPVYEGYGLSECASVVSLNVPGEDKPGTAGKALPHARLRIENGEIVIENPGFLGYVGESTKDPFPTGDLGVLDDEGYLSVTGRKKNVLITSYGRNVSPEWVEATLLSRPAIAQAFVYGDAQPTLSALIVPSYQGADILSAVESANKTLPDYARVRDFYIVPPFTVENGMLTGTGRPRRERILAHFIKEEKTDELLRTAG